MHGEWEKFCTQHCTVHACACSRVAGRPVRAAWPVGVRRQVCKEPAGTERALHPLLRRRAARHLGGLPPRLAVSLPCGPWTSGVATGNMHPAHRLLNPCARLHRCAIDIVPRSFDAEQCNMLCNFAEMVVREFEKEKIRVS